MWAPEPVVPSVLIPWLGQMLWRTQLAPALPHTSCSLDRQLRKVGKCWSSYTSIPSAATHVLLFLPLPPSPHSISLFPALLWANCLTQYMMCSLCSRPSWDPSKTILQSWVQPSGCQLVIPVVEGELQPMHISALCHGIDAELQS